MGRRRQRCCIGPPSNYVSHRVGARATRRVGWRPALVTAAGRARESAGKARSACAVKPSSRRQRVTGGSVRPGAGVWTCTLLSALL
eukprot:365223-Chlamydomonas_euryale.AAC.4